MHNFELVFIKGFLMDKISERDSWQDSVIVAFFALVLYWSGVVTIRETLGLNLEVATNPSTLVLFWLISYSFWRIYTKPELHEFQLHSGEPVCQNCGNLSANTICEDCLPEVSNQMPNHFGKRTMRRINIVTNSMLVLIVYNFIFLNGRNLLLWDVFPNVSQNFDLLINTLVSMTAVAFYIGIVYFSTSILLMCFGNTTHDELSSMAERSNEYEDFYFGSLTRKGKIAFLREYKHSPFPSELKVLIQRMNPATSIFLWVNWLATIVSFYVVILLLDEDFSIYTFPDWVSSLVYYLAVFILVGFVYIANESHLQDSREQIFQRVSHLFIGRIEVELLGMEDE